MKQRGMTKKQFWLCHVIQQTAALVAVLSVFILFVYSYVGIPGKDPAEEEDAYFRLDLFEDEERFEDTAAFRDMLFASLKEIIRYNVAKSQLETDGEFDGTKEIDIEAFFNRKNTAQGSRGTESFFLLDSSASDGQSSLCYTIEDILKWDRYGKSFLYEDMSEEEFFSCFSADADRVEQISGQLTEQERIALQQAYQGSLITAEGAIYLTETSYEDLNTLLLDAYEDWYEAELKGEKPDPAFGRKRVLAQLLLSDQSYGLIDGIYQDQTGALRVVVKLLEDVSLPRDGRTLLQHASSWEEYAENAAMVVQVVGDVAYNYAEYRDFEERYREGKTNIVYLFRMNMLGEELEVSNLSAGVSEAVRDEYFKNLGKYIIYRPQSMFLDTNTGMDEEDPFFYAFSSYAYAYPETGKIWLAVDTSYPVEDVFAQAAAGYSRWHPYAGLLVILAVAGILVWFSLLVYVSVMTGYRREKGEPEAKLHTAWTDQIATELMLLLAAVCVLLPLGTCYSFYYSLSRRFFSYLTEHRLFACLTAGAAGLLFSMVFCTFWYSFLRRCKTGMLWKNSILCKLVGLVRHVAEDAYDNSAVWLQTLLLGGGIMLSNFLLGILFYRSFWHYVYAREKWYLLLLMVGAVLLDAGILFGWFVSKKKRKQIMDGIWQISEGEIAHKVRTDGLHGENLRLAQAVNSIGDGIKAAVETSMKDERLKADLITNVSHDIKTPLTSIINYVDLLKREKIETEPVKGYIEILDAKSQRLKQLTDDLVEASKISSGNITLEMTKINLTELLKQTVGEFSERFEDRQLTVVENFSETAIFVEADSRRIWRVVENLFGNICKYAMAGTRVYLDLSLIREGEWVEVSIKNISAQPLNIKADELTERFIRGDVSRSTEGSGLGLSIAKNLTVLQNGKFEIYLDGDLFKAQLLFPVYRESENGSV